MANVNFVDDISTFLGGFEGTSAKLGVILDHDGVMLGHLEEYLSNVTKFKTG